MAENAGRQQMYRGAVIGNTISQATQIPAQMIEDRRRQAVIDREQAQRETSLRYAGNEDARKQGEYDMQNTALAAKAKRDQVLRDGIAVGFSKSSDPKDFDEPAAIDFVVKSGHPELAPTITETHRTLLPKYTEFDPKKGERDQYNNIVRQPVPELKTTTNDLALLAQNSNPFVATLADKALTRAQTASHSPIYKEWQDYTATGGKLGFDAYMTADANRKKPVVNVTGPNAPPPAGDFTKTGEDFLKTIPVQWRNTVKKIAAYEEDPTKVASMRGGNREMLAQWVNQVNPGYKADEFANRKPTRERFTTGTQGQQINAINTAIGHIDQLTGLADKLGNSSFIPANELMNFAKTMTGGTAVTNFDTLKDALAGEVASVLSKSGSATVSGIKAAEEKIKASKSPSQLAGYVETLIPVLGSKLSSLDYQYHQAMGPDDPFSALSPDVKAILTKHGFDPAHPTVGANSAAAPIKVGGFTVTVKPK